MANSIALFKTYIDLLDEVYRQAAKSSVLDMSGALVTAGANANEIVIPKYSMDGLADYKRNSGYVLGDVSLTYENVTYNYDRGRKFNVDAMDNAESAGIAFGSLSSKFIRDRVVPEMDAFRFAQYAGTDNILSSSDTFTSGEDILTSLAQATNKMDEEEVSETGRILFITPTLLTTAKTVDTNKSKEILDRFSSIVMVPQKRFYTGIDLLDGTSENELAGGFKKADGAKNINYLIIEPSATMQYTKHTVSKVFSPEENQMSDGWAFVYRAYGLCDVYENKTAGIYLSRAAV